MGGTGRRAVLRRSRAACESPRMARLHITGAPGSGTTTLGAAVATRLGWPLHDTDDYFWAPSDPPFTAVRPMPDRLIRLHARLAGTADWVLSGALGGWGDALVPESPWWSSSASTRRPGWPGCGGARQPGMARGSSRAATWQRCMRPSWPGPRPKTAPASTSAAGCSRKAGWPTCPARCCGWIRASRSRRWPQRCWPGWPDAGLFRRAIPAAPKDPAAAPAPARAHAPSGRPAPGRFRDAPAR